MSMNEHLNELKQRVFQAKEERAAEQQRLICAFQAPLISMTLILPGGYAAYPQWQALFGRGCTRLDRTFPKALSRTRRLGQWGPEAFYVIDQDPMAIKDKTCQLEDEEPLGRLFDMDVIDRQGKPVSRTLLGKPFRTCLVCQLPAVECYVARNHSLDTVMTAVTKRLEGAIIDER